MSDLLRILRQLGPRSISLAAGFLVVSAVLELATVLLLRIVFLLALAVPHGAFHVGPVAIDIPSDTRGKLLAFVAALLFIAVKSILLALLWSWVLREFAEEQAKLSQRLFERRLRVPYLIHMAQPLAAAQNVLTMAIANVFSQLIVPGISILSECLIAAAIFFLLLIISPLATLVVTFWLVVVAAIFRAVTVRRSHKAGVAASFAYERMLSVTYDGLSEIKLVKLWAREKFFGEWFYNVSGQFARALATDRFLNSMSRYFFELALIGGLVALYAVISLTSASQSHLLAELSLFAAAAVRILPSAQRIAGQSHMLSFHQRSLKTVAEGLSEAIERLTDQPTDTKRPPFQGSLELHDVSLDYEIGGKPILDRISLRVRRGDKIAISGASGAGKSSLVNVLLGFVPPSGGSIVFDGKVLSPLARFRESSVALVSQDFVVLADTVAANIIFGGSRSTGWEARAWEALRLAHLDARVATLPDGLGTFVGKGGAILSGGEQQRLVLARALYEDPSFLVLDEALSQVDVETERQIMDQLLSRSPDFTLVIISHRMESVAQFPMRYCLADGRLSLT